MPEVAAVPPSGPSRSAVPLPKGRRRTELAMLGFAIGIVAFAYAAVGLGLNGHVPSGLVVYVGGFAVMMLLAHAVVRKFAPWADPLMLPLAALLNGIGIVMIYRLQESGRGGNPGLQISTLTAHAALYQLVWTAVGHGRVRRRAGGDPPAEDPAALYLYSRHDRPDPARDPGAAAREPQSRCNGREGLDHPRRLLHPARRVRQDRARRLLRRLPGREARRAVAGRTAVPRDRPAARPRPRPHPGALG